MNYTIYFSVCSLFYIIMLLFVMKKQKGKTDTSNKILRSLATINLVSLIIEIICTISAINIKSDTLFMEIIVRLFLVCLLAWMITFIIYIFTVLYNRKNKSDFEIKKDRKKITIISIILFIISIIMVIILPVEYNFSKIYSYGPAINYVNYFSDVLLIIALIYLFSHYNKTNGSKCTPFFAFIAGGVAMSIIQSYDPRLLLANTIETFVTYMVYFTLNKDENLNFKNKAVTNNEKENK